MSTLRPRWGPGLIWEYEHELAAFDGLDPTDVRLDDCLQRPYRWVPVARVRSLTNAWTSPLGTDQSNEPVSSAMSPST